MGVLDKWICKIEKVHFYAKINKKFCKTLMQLFYSKYINLHNYTSINVSNF